MVSDGQSVPALSTTRSEESRGRESSGQASRQDTGEYNNSDFFPVNLINFYKFIHGQQSALTSLAIYSWKLCTANLRWTFYGHFKHFFFKFLGSIRVSSVKKRSLFVFYWTSVHHLSKATVVATLPLRQLSSDWLALESGTFASQGLFGHLLTSIFGTLAMFNVSTHHCNSIYVTSSK